MTDQNQAHRGVLYIIACAARPARHIQELVILAQAAGWDVCVIATRQSTKFLDIPLLRTHT